MITIFMYRIEDGKYSHKLVSTIDTAMLNVTDTLDYTLKEPPDYLSKWYWKDNKWVTEENSND